MKDIARLDFLDLGRGLSILGVIGVHTVESFRTGWQPLDGVIGMGQFGVQLFYVISAYTMCLTLGGRASSERHPVQNFLLRRFWRIAPPFWCAMVLYLGLRASGVDFFYMSTRDDAFSIVSSVCMVQGFWPTSLSSIVPGGGSIATEVIFYALFPLVFLFRRRLWMLAIIGIAGILLDRLALRPLYRAAFDLVSTPLSEMQVLQFFHFSIVNQFPVFLVGILLFELLARKAELTVRDLVGMAIFLVAFAVASPAMCAIALIAAAILVGFLRLDAAPVRSLAWLSWLGRHSYSLYLFHFAVLDLLILALADRLRGLPMVPFIVAFALATLITSAIAAATKPLLEDAGSRIGRYLVRANERRKAGVVVRPEEVRVDPAI